MSPQHVNVVGSSFDMVQVDRKLAVGELIHGKGPGAPRGFGRMTAARAAFLLQLRVIRADPDYAGPATGEPGEGGVRLQGRPG